MLTLEEVQAVFPEAREVDSSGHVEFVVHCPEFHKKGGIYKMTINAETGAYYCHDCNNTGNAFEDFFDDSAQFFPGLRIKRDAPRTVQRFRIFDKSKEWKDGVSSPGKMVPLTSLPAEHPASEYLFQTRGFTRDDLQNFGLLYCLEGYYQFTSRIGSTSGRIIFPVVMNGELIGWQARVVEKTDKDGRRVWKGEKDGWWTPKIRDGVSEDAHVPKYYTYPNMQRARTLLNFDEATKDPSIVVVVEGPLDAVKVGEHGVATFGKLISDGQIRILSSYWSTVLLIRDKDVDPDQKWFVRMSKKFNESVNFLHMSLDGYSDPGEASNAEIWKQIKKNFNIER